MADVAQAAGLAKGTVFRHFATRQDLVAAVVRGHLEALADAAAEALGRSGAADDLSSVLALVVRSLRPIDLVVLEEISSHDAAVGESADRLTANVQALLTRAQRVEEIRGDVDAQDLLSLACALAHASRRAADAWHRPLAVVMDGLRNRASGAPAPASSAP